MSVRIAIPAEVRERYRRSGYWRDSLIDSHLVTAAAGRPDALAVVDGDHRLTYAGLDDAVRATARGLHRLGLGAGDVISWQLPNWHEAVVLHHAVLRLGAVSNPIVPIHRHREVGYVLATARSRAVVVPGSFRGFDHARMIEELRPGLPALEHVVVVRPGPGHTAVDLVALMADGGPAPEVPGRTADDPALLMFTSGTTADPKGVVHTHNSLDYENRSIIDVYGLREDDVVFMPSPVAHITGLLYGLQLPAMLGTAVVLQDVWDPRRALELIALHRCAFTLAATPFLHGLTHDPALGEFDVGSLRVFACGGADVPSALIEVASERLGCSATRIYGSTEFPTLSTSPPDAPLHRRARTDGRVIGAAEFRVVDATDAAVGPDEVGELLVRGPELFAGYLGGADDRDAFTAGGWFRTGDLATADADGYISIRGRKKDVILRGGENISATEVEDLLFAHPGVREIAIVAMPDPVMVERACAFVVPEPGADLSLGELAAYLRGERIAVQKIPERLELLDELPKTPSGKIQKFRLRQLIRDKLAAGN